MGLQTTKFRTRKHHLTPLKPNIKYEENTRVMKRRRDGNIALFTSNPKKTPNIKIKYGHKQREIRRKERNRKDVTPTSGI